jgi:hypothetical protein
MRRSLLLILALPLTLTLAQGIPSFTDKDYENLLRRESRILFYSFSPSMPSIRGAIVIVEISSPRGAVFFHESRRTHRPGLSKCTRCRWWKDDNSAGRMAGGLRW